MNLAICVVLQSYRIHQAYIATQAPLNTTVHDIWRLVYDSGSHTIVMLNQINDNAVRLNINRVYIYIHSRIFVFKMLSIFITGMFIQKYPYH